MDNPRLFRFSVDDRDRVGSFQIYKDIGQKLIGNGWRTSNNESEVREKNISKCIEVNISWC